MTRLMYAFKQLLKRIYLAIEGRCLMLTPLHQFNDRDKEKSNILSKMGIWKKMPWNNREMFPTTLSFFIFIAYMTLFVNQGLLVTASRNGAQNYPYNPTTVVLLTEVLKLVISSAIYLKEHSITYLMKESIRHSKILAYYMIPAFLYCLYNNLSFTNLAVFDPTTYFMLMQGRLLMTGVIYQFLFKRYLSRIQWLSLFLITLGCMFQKMDFQHFANLSNPETTINYWHIITLSTGLFFIILQMSCSVFAGVYNEYLIKNIAGNDVHIMIQNIFMYIDSIICNLVVLTFKGNLTSAFNPSSLVSILQVLVMCIIVNNALVGIVTSLFLKNLNSILKSFASALELVLTAIFSYIVLSIPLHWNTVLAVSLVAYAVILYSRNPLKSDRGQSIESNKFETKERGRGIDMDKEKKLLPLSHGQSQRV